MKYSLLAICLIFLACQEQQPPTSTESTQTIQPVRELVMDGLRRPWSMVFLNEEEALVAEKDGDLLKVNIKTKERIAIQGFPSDLTDSLIIDTLKNRPFTYPHSAHGKKLKFNAGIFEVHLDPDFTNNNWVYISYVSQIDKKELFTTKVIRAQLQNNRLENIDSLLTIRPYVPGLFHFGGGMCFGQDGKLYVTVGERLFTEGQQPPMPIAQDLKDQRGKIYRLNPDGSIPEDNPDFGPGAPPGMYAVGIRAAQGITLHPENGQIWFSEHGTHQGDEVNILTKGANYGWPVKTTGTYRGPGYVPPPLEGRVFKDPVWFWKKTVAPTGLCFYTGTEFPEWHNNLIIPGLSGGSLWRFVLEGNKVKSAEELFLDEHIRSRKVVQSPGGQLYQLTDENNGRIIRIKRG